LSQIMIFIGFSLMGSARFISRYSEINNRNQTAEAAVFLFVNSCATRLSF
jgi:hypothetical protein